MSHEMLTGQMAAPVNVRPAICSLVEPGLIATTEHSTVESQLDDLPLHLQLPSRARSCQDGEALQGVEHP